MKMAVDEYMYLDLRDTSRQDFVQCLNRLAMNGWRPIWKSMEETEKLNDSADISIYLFRVRNITRENKLEQQIILEEEGTNRYAEIERKTVELIQEIDLQGEASEDLKIKEALR